MEMILYTVFSERIFLPWDRLLRVGLIFLLSGALLLSVQRYMGDIEGDSGANAAKAVFSGSEECDPEENETMIREMAMRTDKILPGENTDETGFLPGISEVVAKAEIPDHPKDMHARNAADTIDPFAVVASAARSEEGMMSVTGESDVGIKVSAAGEIEITADASGNSGTESDMPVMDVPETDAKDLSGIEDESANEVREDDGADVNGVKVISGFHLDAHGYITGTDSDIDVTDAVLIIPAVPECAGIRDGALSGIEESVFEIYIPANIRDIAPGAFAGLTSLMFVEVAEDNPDYCSIDGVLYSREGEEIFSPYRGMSSVR